MDTRSIFEKLFGYCPCCDRWFCRGIKRRRMSTQYTDDGSNYITVCKLCFDDIEGILDEQWKEYNSERMGGWTL